MKYIVMLLCSMTLAMEQPSPKQRPASVHDLEKAVADLKKEQKAAKSCCRLTKPRVAALTTIISSALTAAVTIATVYGSKGNACPPAE